MTFAFFFGLIFKVTVYMMLQLQSVRCAEKVVANVIAMNDEFQTIWIESEKKKEYENKKKSKVLFHLLPTSPLNIFLLLHGLIKDS